MTMPRAHDTDEYTLAPVTHEQIGRAMRVANGHIDAYEPGRFVYDGSAIWYQCDGCEPDVVATTLVGPGEPTREIAITPDVSTEYPVFWNIIHDEVQEET